MTDVYSTSEWLNAREDALDRDRVCQDCGRSDHLHVHHIEPVRTFEDVFKAHDLDNLVVLCQWCHPVWEGSDEVPNLIDESTGLKKSELVHDLSRDTIDRAMPEPMGRDVELLWECLYWNRTYRCQYCYASLPRTRGKMLRRSKNDSGREHLCDNCGRLPHFWRNFDGAPDVDTMKSRCEHIVDALEECGIYLNEKAMRVAVETVWSKDEYFGEVKIVTRFAIRLGAKHANSPVSDRKFPPRCPVPDPVSPV